MSKFIRTKERIIYVGDLIKDEYGNYCDSKDYETIEVSAEYIIKEADTIDKLCDEFVVIRNDIKINQLVRTDNIKYLKEMMKNDKRIVAIKGAIWTDKGLIYVAKLNEKGELELI